MSSARRVPCPSCGKIGEYSKDNEWRPFCSERCRTMDLGAWASGAYAIPQAPGEAEPGDPADEPDGPGKDATQ